MHATHGGGGGGTKRNETERKKRAARWWFAAVRYNETIDKHDCCWFTRPAIGKIAAGYFRSRGGNSVCRRRGNKGSTRACSMPVIDGNSTRVPFIFNLCFKSPSRALATRVDAVFANIDSEKRRTMPLIFCFQCPLCQSPLLSSNRVLLLSLLFSPSSVLLS